MIRTSRYTTIMSRKLEEVRSGAFRIEKVIVSKGTTLRTYSPQGFLYSDTFDANFPIVRLIEGEPDPQIPGLGLWMSDTPLEQESLRGPTHVAYGDVLEIGLGIGLFPTLLRRNKSVKSITIVERGADLVPLVYHRIRYKKTKLVLADGEEWLKFCQATERKYDFIHIDVWADLTAPMKEIEKWTKLAEPCLKKDGIIWCWLQELYNRIKDRLPQEPIKYPGPPAIYEPCLICGKKLRNDYAGLCMDCADNMEISEVYVKT